MISQKFEKFEKFLNLFETKQQKVNVKLILVLLFKVNPDRY